MKRYVLGLAFTPTGVVMVEKNRPQWQAGKLNFIGGKVEEGETYKQTMVREFKEETGVDTTEDEWTWCGVMHRKVNSLNGEGEEGNFECWIYRTKPDEKFHECRTVEDENIVHVTHDKFSFDSELNQWYISNIRTIYEFARSRDHLEQACLMELHY